jgi:RNase P/RNase MRP subunit p30
MFVFVKYNDLYNQIIPQIKKHEFTPITLFDLELSEKNQIKEELSKIKTQITTLKINYTAIRLFLKKIDNSTPNIIDNLKKEFDIVIGYGGMNKINRYFLEQTKIDFLQDPQNSSYYNKIDFIHHFNSSLNHVLCEIAKQKQIKFIFSLNFTQNSKKNIPKEIGRINQNIKFASKYSIPLYINYIITQPNQILSLNDFKRAINIFNLNNYQKKESINILEETIKNNRLKRSKEYINENIQFEN